MSEWNAADPVILPSGQSMPRDSAQAHHAMLLAAAAALTYVSEPMKWPGFTAWAEQASPELGGVHTEDLRVMFVLWAAHLMAMAQTVGEIVEGGGGEDTRR